MIKQESIDKVLRDSVIEDVIGDFVKLKKSGSSWKGKSPFTNEKTPSFYVVPSKSLFKDFSSGKGGGVIQFLMEQNKTFPEAIEYLADKYNIELEYEETSVATEEIRDKKKEMFQVADWTAKQYHEYLQKTRPDWVVKELYSNRRITVDSVIQWKIGFAPHEDDFEWKFITSQLIEKGQYEPACDLGLIKSKNGNNYDGYRNRVIIPIQDPSGRVIGFGGRKQEDGKKENPKYINTSDCLIYNKSEVLFGLNYARNEMARSKKAILVEGYWDVIKLHQAGINTAVASCGTSFTLEQAKLIKRYTNSGQVIVFFDGDDAGRKKAFDTANVLTKVGLDPHVVLFPIDGDPDDLVTLYPNTIEHRIEKLKQKAPWAMCNYLLEGLVDPGEITNAINQVADSLALIESEHLRDGYVRKIAKDFRQKHAILNKLVQHSRKRIEQDLAAKTKKIPKLVLNASDVDPDAEKDLENYGFFLKGNQYFSLIKTKEKWEHSAFSNFQMRVLYHIKSKNNPIRVVQLTNVDNLTQMVEVPTQDLSTLGRFIELIERHGNYVFWGTKDQYTQLKLKYFAVEEPAKSIEVLGWNKGGFYAYGNCLVADGGVFKPDYYGVIRYQDQAYYLPSSNNSNLEDDTAYLDERKFNYKDSEVRFDQWSDLFCKVYGNPGQMGLLYILCCLFSDVVFDTMKGFPIPFLYGQPGSGKGALIKSLQCLFGTPQDPIKILGKSTGKAQQAVLAQWVNSMLLFEEWPQRPTEDQIEFVKGLWDRYGYKRKTRDYSFRTDNVPVTSGAMLTGNNYPSQNDPMLTRFIVLEINKANRSADAKELFRLLEAMEESSITPIVSEIIKHRKRVVKEYRTMFFEAEKQTSELLQKVGVDESRMINNVAALIAMHKVFSDVFKMPFSEKQVLEYAVLAMKKQQEKRKTGNSVAHFWDCIAYLLRNRKIKNGREIIVDGDKVYLQLKNIFGEYSQAHRIIFNETGLDFAAIRDKLTLENYKAFVKKIATHRFPKGKNTSCFLFNANEIDIDLDAIVLEIDTAEREKRELFDRDNSINSNPNDNDSPF